jgi:hypothetical protein
MFVTRVVQEAITQREIVHLCCLAKAVTKNNEIYGKLGREKCLLLAVKPKRFLAYGGIKTDTQVGNNTVLSVVSYGCET